MVTGGQAQVQVYDTAGMPSEWLTATEAAQYLKVRARTLVLWARQGKVKAYALSGVTRRVWRFRAADLDAMLLTSSAGSADRRQQ
jgi:excisionase family DNA binding protein